MISIYRHALCEMCDDEDDLAEEIYVTVIHEVAHAAGIDDEPAARAGMGLTTVSGRGGGAMLVDIAHGYGART